MKGVSLLFPFSHFLFMVIHSAFFRSCFFFYTSNRIWSFTTLHSYLGKILLLLIMLYVIQCTCYFHMYTYPYKLSYMVLSSLSPFGHFCPGVLLNYFLAIRSFRITLLFENILSLFFVAKKDLEYFKENITKKSRIICGLSGKRELNCNTLFKYTVREGRGRWSHFTQNIHRLTY